MLDQSQPWLQPDWKHPCEEIQDELEAESAKLKLAVINIIGCTHRPNPTDPSRIDVAPGKHGEFQAAIEAASNLVK